MEGYGGSGGYGYPDMGYQTAPATGYLWPPQPIPPLPEPQYSQSQSVRVDGRLYQYDLFGNLMNVTRVPRKSWPQGGPDALQALCRTQGYWSARLRGLQAGDYTTAKGTATFWLDENNQEMHFRVDVHCLLNITSAYIYLADPNLPMAAAPAVAPIYTGRTIGGRYCGNLAEGTLVSHDLMGWLNGQPIGSLVEALDKGEAYIRINTTQHPEGEIAGVASPILLEQPAS